MSAGQLQATPATAVTPAMQVAAGAGRATSRRGVRCLLLAAALHAALGLAGCQGHGDAAGTLPMAPAASADATGPWLGGPEPVSGKLRSGITSRWRLPDQRSAGQPFELLLRLDDVQAAGATVSVSTTDGARLASAAAPRQWALQPGQPAQLRLQLVAPAGDSYLHVTTQQRGRSSVRSVLLALPVAPGASAGARFDRTTDAGGAPIVRMQAGRSR